ncbi:hypothetical protein JMA_22090 [Jeotgalibacillus malaysiensis]|uniref:Uncharacterized protein n=1 Tax=Jeotgalibacillus malaysiensis TaxID=1508404 RepID=A0A0B5AN08_9BACL|nr:hypothetical protein [Jeotgalibacillus malaysiensis]AJD91526.1 hypothetical protein JMA_22090 [Jeotgalibacillus malaysiensis]
MVNKDKYYKIIAHNLLSEFCIKFSKYQSQLKSNLRSFDLDISKALPKVFQGNHFYMEAVYSIDKKQVLINFFEDNETSYRTFMGNGEVIDYLDTTGTWSKSNTAIKAINSNVRIEGMTIKDIRPFRLEGNSELYFQDLQIELPNGKDKTIDYGILLSFEKFYEIYKDINNFVFTLYNMYWMHFEKYKEKLNAKSSEQYNHVQYIERVLKQMEFYFYEKVPEKQIDDFFKDNPYISEVTLGLVDIKSQVVLKDVLKMYGQDLKPDALGLDPVNNRWTIIDYKLGNKKNIVKGANGVRASLMSSVSDLEAQLRTYRNYFDDSTHRESFLNKNGFSVSKGPNTIGIIGYVDETSIKDFEELMSEKPQWFKVLPYNYIKAKMEVHLSKIKNLR